MDPTAPDARHLVEYLADRDESCPACGYNLRGLRDDRCPECRGELRLTLQRAEPDLRTYLAAVLGLAAGAGFSGVLWVVGLAAGTDAIRSPLMRTLLVASVIEGALLAALLCLGPAFRRRSAGARIAAAVACWIATGLLAAIVARSIR